MSASTHPRRFQFRFSLRTFLILVAALSVVVGLFSRASYRASRQRAAVEKIRELGGGAGYFSAHEKRTEYPRWLRNRLGEDFFYHVRSVHAIGSAGDPLVPYLQEFPQLESLDLHGPGMNDQALKEIGRCVSLRRLGLSATAITDTGLEHLRALRQLETLDLTGVTLRIEGPGLVHLRDLGQLKSLNLDLSRVSDESLSLLPPQLESLSMNYTSVGDAGAEHLSKLVLLRDLSIRNNRKLTPVGLSHLAKLPRLESLILSDSNVTDEGISLLAEIKSLRTLEVGTAGTFPDAKRMTDASLKSIAKLSQLEVLLIGPIEVTDSGMANLAGLTELKQLGLHN